MKYDTTALGARSSYSQVLQGAGASAVIGWTSSVTYVTSRLSLSNRFRQLLTYGTIHAGSRIWRRSHFTHVPKVLRLQHSFPRLLRMLMPRHGPRTDGGCNGHYSWIALQVS